MTLRTTAILFSGSFLGLASLVQMYNELAIHFYDQGAWLHALYALPTALPISALEKYT